MVRPYKMYTFKIKDMLYVQEEHEKWEWHSPTVSH
jgi:hypothetical protein